MAGDWIKMRSNLWDDPRVAKVCDITDQSEAAVIGAMYWLWAMADQHTEDGILPGLTLRQIDRKTGLPGFGQAMCDIGWLADHPDGVRIVRFEEHNGASAKKRAATAKRVALHRSGEAGNADSEEEQHDGNADVTQPALQDERTSVTGALAREEKRREEKEETTTSLRSVVVGGAAQAPSPPDDHPPQASPPKAKPRAPDFLGDANVAALNGHCIAKLAEGWELPEQWGLDAEALGWKPDEILREAERFRQYWVHGKGAGTRRSVKGWRQSWSNWLAKAERFKP